MYKSELLLKRSEGLYELSIQSQANAHDADRRGSEELCEEHANLADFLMYRSTRLLEESQNASHNEQVLHRRAIEELEHENAFESR